MHFILLSRLHDNKLTSEVIYPGLESHPQYELASRQQLNPNGIQSMAV